MIEEQIKKARDKVAKAKAAYDKAVEELSVLLDEQKRLNASKNMTLESWSFTWDGKAIWDCGNGTVDCVYHAEVEFDGSSDITGPEVKKLQIEDPEFSKEDLYLALEKSLRSMLDDEFEDYCTEDDYYQPVVEDFEAEEYIKDWAKERGLEIIDFEGDGSDRGYEPKFWQRW